MSIIDLAPDGQPFNIVRLHNRQGMSVKFCDWGATWLSCCIPVDQQLREVLLGCRTPLQYVQQNAYLGATIGRYANRIAGAHIDYLQAKYPLSVNQDPHQLHGGLLGFDKRRWQISQQSDCQVTFSLLSIDGDQGFPGNLSVTACYMLDEDNKLHIDFSATTDHATPVNLTNHAYFNLDGDENQPLDVRYHYLQVNANQYLPIDKAGIPLGDLVAVDHDDMDLRQKRRLMDNFLASAARKRANGYDHAYLLNTCGDSHAVAAQLVSSDNLVTLNISTTKPALQVYTGNFLAGTPNRKGGDYQNYSGIALETQFLPDSPHHIDWPQTSCWLLPHQVYHHQTVYQFL